MSLGKQIRLHRLFAHPSGRLCGVAVDHFFSYGFETLPAGLRRVERTIAQLVAGRPDTITLHRGVAAAVWPRFAGQVAFILQSTIMRPDDSGYELLAEPEDAVRMGADAFAVAGFVRGATEARTVRTIADCVRQAARWEMPVVAHVYPRVFDDGARVSYTPEDIAWAVRCAFEAGADVIKVPYCGDVKAYAQIVAECPAPVVAAGGPKTKNLTETLVMLRDVVRSGARGAVIGRNVWGAPGMARTLGEMKKVIHGEP